MTRSSALFLMLIAFGATACQDDRAQTSAVDAAITQCDVLTAHPLDPQKPADIAGIADEASINARLALEACNTASRARPDLTRLKFQMGRAALAGGNPEVARGWMFAATREGHPLAASYLQQIDAARPRANLPAQSVSNGATAQNPHADFERQIGWVLTGAAGLIALDQAIVATSNNPPAQPLPPGATVAQCQAAVTNRTLHCQEVSTLTFSGESTVYEMQCNSRWQQENRTCTRGTGGQQSLPGSPDFYCDPVTNTRERSREAVVADICGG